MVHWSDPAAYLLGKFWRWNRVLLSAKLRKCTRTLEILANMVKLRIDAFMSQRHITFRSHLSELPIKWGLLTCLYKVSWEQSLNVTDKLGKGNTEKGRPTFSLLVFRNCWYSCRLDWNLKLNRPVLGLLNEDKGTWNQRMSLQVLNSSVLYDTFFGWGTKETRFSLQDRFWLASSTVSLDVPGCSQGGADPSELCFPVSFIGISDCSSIAIWGTREAQAVCWKLSGNGRRVWNTHTHTH